MKKIFSLFAAVLFAGSMIMATEATLQYTGSTTQNMSASDNNAELVGLDADIFTVLSDKCSASNEVGLNKAGNIRLYAHKDSGNGTKLIVSITGGTINSVVLDIAQETTFALTVGGEEVEAVEGVYTIAAASFIIQNTTSGENVQLWFNKITIDYTVSTPIAVSKPTIVGAANFQEYVTVSIECTTEDAEIHYTLDGSDPDAESELYSDPFNLEESATVKAIAIKGNDASFIAEKVFTIYPTEFTCADAAVAALSVAANNQLYADGLTFSVTGFVTEIAYAWEEGSMSFWMADEADGDNTLEAYKCAIENEEDAPAVGDKVKVTGKLTKYNSTPEFATGNTCVILEKKPTAIDNVAADTKAQKIIRDGQLYILRDGQLFNANGAAVK